MRGQRLNTGWVMRVMAGGGGIVSHAWGWRCCGRRRTISLTGGLSPTLASDRLLVHDRGQVVADLARVIADGGDAQIADVGAGGSGDARTIIMPPPPSVLARSSRTRRPQSRTTSVYSLRA